MVPVFELFGSMLKFLNSQLLNTGSASTISITPWSSDPKSVMLELIKRQSWNNGAHESAEEIPGPAIWISGSLLGPLLKVKPIKRASLL